ncbi:MAG: M23 family metallopeptidase [Thermoleophilia bacterium]|nr:M23 family metallopeptidase [Thermoleophilia bacterium]
MLAAGLLGGPALAAPPKRIIFPVIGPVTYTNDFGAPRGDRRHQGNDIMAARRAPVVAVERGRVEIPSWSRSDCALIVHGRSGTDYWYLHLNNDVGPGNDNRGGCGRGTSYARGLANGERVRAGELVGYVGDSGDANGISPHLHFELHPNGGRAVSPYRWLTRAPRLLYAVRGDVPRVRLALFGRVRSLEEEFGLLVRAVAVSGGWRGKSAPRVVRLAHAREMRVERARDGEVFPARLARATIGERVTVWTTVFEPTLATQIARPGVLSAERIRLRGLPGGR